MYILDQGFTVKNFKYIYLKEKRKGVLINNSFNSSYLEEGNIIKFIDSIKTVNKQLRNTNTLIKKQSNDESHINRLKTLKKFLNNKKEELKRLEKIELDKLLNIIVNKINKQGFNIEMEKIFDKKTNKDIFKIINRHEDFFVLKQLQHNLKKIHNVKQANRISIVNELKNILSDDLPKKIIKLDIKDFYETISFNEIEKTLDDQNYLNHLSKKYIKQVNNNYKKLSGNTKGIPRGIGISPYLSEIFMKDIDKKIKNINGVYYYARYVDDIILVTIDNDIKYLDNIKDILKEKGLKINHQKTKIIVTKNINKKSSFDYLGYNFSLKKDGVGKNIKINLDIDLSKKKELKYKAKIDLIIKNFKINNLSEKKSKNLLLKRVRFLTSNIQLINNKKDIIVGIYFTNGLITSKNRINRLDKYLKQNIKNLNLSTQLENKILKNTFIQGFDKKKAYLLNSNHSGDKISKYKKITNIWKYV